MAFLPAACYGSGNKAQSVLEYAVVVLALVLALLAMQGYIRRGMQGKLRQAADSLGQQYAPANTTGKHSLSHSGTTRTIAMTLSENQLNNEDVDINGDGLIDRYHNAVPIDLSQPPNGLYDDTNVFATETLTIIDNETVQQTGDENVGPLESSLFN